MKILKTYLLISVGAFVLAWLVAIFGGLYTTIFPPEPSFSPITRVHAAVPIGMPQDDAVLVLEQLAWYHQTCDDSTDLFFFDNHDYDDTTIVIMDSNLQDGQYCVASFSTFESYAWHTVYDDCVDRSQFD